MPEHSFTPITEGDVEAKLDELFETGCDDATFGTVNGVHHADFDRETPKFEQAVASAVADVVRVGGLRTGMVDRRARGGS